MPGPLTAVVVSTCNRRDRLTRLVGALERQAGAPPFELVVVDDGSTDGSWDELQRLASAAAIAMKPMRIAANAGPATARNLGWRSTLAPFVVFTDDDCVPAPGWVAAMSAALATADIVQGVTRPDPGQWEQAPAWSQTMDVSEANIFYETCNVGYRREVLERVRGFDESFRYPYGEDADLAWRAKRTGVRSSFVSNAVVFHDVTSPSFRERLRQARRLEGAVQLAARHPGLRSVLHRGRWFRRSHPPALLAVAGFITAAGAVRATLPMRLGLAAAALIPYLGFRLRGARLTDDTIQNLRLLPLAFLEDVVQIAVLARASLRFRELVL